MTRPPTLFVLAWVATLLPMLGACDRSPSNTAGTSPPPSLPTPTQAPAASQAAQEALYAKLEAQVIDVIAKQTGVRNSELKSTTRLHKDLVMDDLDNVEMVMELEDVFKIKISDDAAIKWQTVREVVDYVRGQVKP